MIYAPKMSKTHHVHRKKDVRHFAPTQKNPKLHGFETRLAAQTNNADVPDFADHARALCVAA